MDELKIVSLNVRGLRGNKKHAIFQWLKEKHYDICLLQETYCTQSFVSKFKKGWAGDIIQSVSDSAHSRGVCILFRKSLDYTLLDVHQCDDGRLIALNIEINGNVFSIMNVYCPNNLTQRIEFLGKVDHWVNSYVSNKQNLLIGGDFNCVNDKMDRLKSGTDKSTEILNKLKCEWGLVDIWRKINPESKTKTYIDPSNRGYSSRIDFFLCSNNIAINVCSSDIGCAPSPDHKFVNVIFKLSNKKRGKGYWKMNASVLNESEYSEHMEMLLTETINEYEGHIDNEELWEFLKVRIKTFTIEYCVYKARKKHDKIKLLEIEIEKYDSILTGGKNQSIFEKRKECKQVLDTMYQEKATGYQIRSRSKWIEQGEKSTKYFFGLEKTRQCESTIQALKDKTGNTKNDDKEILDVAQNFYTDLYKTENIKNIDIDNYIKSIPLENTLTEDDKLLCEGDITYNECTSAVNDMKGNKSPGLDGIVVEFYQKYWHLIGTLIVKVYNSSFEKGKLINSQRLSVMTLIHKKDDRDDIANYRPISLTNVDYRIAAFVLANRLQQVAKLVIGIKLLILRGDT
jgi:exonuclease III